MDATVNFDYYTHRKEKMVSQLDGGWNYQQIADYWNLSRVTVRDILENRKNYIKKELLRNGNMQKRVDENQKIIVEAFRQAGASVLHLHMVGHGCPDLAIGYNGVSVLVEVKHADGIVKLTDDEKEFSDSWRGSYRIIRTVDDVLELMEWIRLGAQ